MNTLKLLSICLITLFISSFFVFTVNASPSFILEPDTSELHLSPHLEILEDKHQELTIDEISSGKYDDDFFSFDGKVPNFGYTNSTYWTKFSFQNKSQLHNWILQVSYPPLDYVTLYIPDETGNFTAIETGDLLPFSSRTIPHRDFVFHLSMPENTIETFYLEIQTEGSSQLPIKLLSAEKFHGKSLIEYFILGLYYGLGLIMVVYNLFIYFSIKMRSYLWYAILVIFVLFAHFTLNGLSYQYLWPDASWWNNRAILFFMAASNTTVLMFTKSFLNTKIYTPRINKILNWAIAIQFILIGVLFVDYQTALNLIIGMMFVEVVLLIITSLISWKNGNPPAKYFFFGWIMFFIGITLSSMSDIGLIPTNFITAYASQMGSGIEIVLFSLALGSKIKWLRLEKEVLEKQALQSQSLAVQHLQQANQIKDEFLANTSHELRTPLQGIIGLTENILTQENFSKETQYELSLIIKSGKKLKHLINDLLDASKLKYQEISLDVRPIHLWQITEVVCQVSAATHDKQITIRNEIDQDLPMVAADEIRLQQILYNLISNAIKYTPRGEIWITAELEDHFIKVHIHDTGIGISRNDLKDIFDNYKRGENIDEVEIGGTGIGLYITRQLVNIQQGEIFIESELGKGTTVSFTVPIFDRNQANLSVPNEQDEIENRASIHLLPSTKLNSQPKKQGRILIIDDESINIHVLINHLSYEGYETITAYDGEEAISILSNQPIDLVILDVMLPKLSGYQVAKIIRESFTLSELPILMLTAKSQIDDITTAFQSGANDYLIKPYAKEELLARVNTLMTLKLMMQELTEVNRELQILNNSLETQVELRTAALEERTSELSQINTARKQLMTNISHELGTPMTSIKGYVKAMLDGVIKPDNEKYISLVYQKILFIERQIQDLYELARLESGQLSFNWESVDIETFITTCLLRYEIDVQENNLTFKYNEELQDDEKAYLLIVDIDRIQQVMHNLIFNAFRFSKSGGELSIHVKIIEQTYQDTQKKAKETKFLQVSVCDNGIGIDQESIKYIFNRFYQKDEGKNSNLNANSGLGLTIAKEIITYHNGSIWAESEYGTGTCIYFTIPVTR
ncbi:7TM diverse intracellular signaling domain-containing protein [Oceanobacillus sp. CAU 1775]